MESKDNQKREIELNNIPIKWDLDKGKFSFFGIDSALFWIKPSLLSMLSPMAEELGHELFRLMIAHSASQGTYEDYHSMITTLGQNFEEGFIAWGKAVSTAGWGIFELSYIDYDKKEALVFIKNTWELALQENLEKPLGCPFIQGKIIGIFSHAFGVNCWADEIEVNYNGNNKYVKFKIYPSCKTIETELEVLRFEKMKQKERKLSLEVKKKTAELIDARKELEKYSKNLENKVAERTFELDQKTVKLNQSLVDIKRAKENAEVANKSKSIFLANMSHELRTPLNVILGFTQLMQHSDEISSEHLGYLKTINRNGEHLLSLINDILDMSKIEAGRITYNESSFDLYQLLDDLESMFYIKSKYKHSQLYLELESNLPQYIYSDEKKLRQVLINLLENSIKFTDKGSIHLKISAEKLPAEACCQLNFKVIDTGCGIPQNDIDSIFNIFTQSPTNSCYKKGTGLGLTISKKFIEIMGGAITVESEIGKGTIFNFYIKVKQAGLKEIKKKGVENQVIGIQEDQPSYKILIVDDNYDNRMVMSKLLTSVGLKNRKAKNGKEAIKIWKDWKPDLIWMDMRMPVMNGYEATRYIKENTSYHKTAVIALTASSFQNECFKIMEVGCDDIVKKPFKKSEVFCMMKKYLNIKYVYKKNAEEYNNSKTDRKHIGNLKVRMGDLPEKIRAKLKESCQCADMNKIDALILEIQKYDSKLALILKSWADNFTYYEILKLID